MRMEDESYKQTYFLNLAQNFADSESTCAKVRVGSCIESMAVDKSLVQSVLMMGCNHGISNCVRNGCRRKMLYGDASKEHRLPSDCDALHSEVDAICKAAKNNVPLMGATIYVTRYPCEACARAIVAAGIKKVVYGRSVSITPYTAGILAAGNVEVVHKIDWEREDNNE